MTEMLNKAFSRKTFLKGGGALVVGFSFGTAGLAGKAQAGAFPIVDHGQLDSWLSIDTKGMVTVRSGRVDQGQGKQTSYAQIVADELDVRFDAVSVILGDTGVTPNQGKSTATNGISSGAPPLRNAAAQARGTLLALASTRLGVPVSQLTVTDGVISSATNPSAKVTYGELIGGKRFNVTMTVTGPTAYNGQSVNVNVVPTYPLKDPKTYKIVGQSIPRVDIPAKVAGAYPYTQHITVPGMLHARMVMPPHVGAYPRMVPQLLSAEFRSKPAAGVQLVVKANFVAVVAEDEWKAIQARDLVETKWADDPAQRNLANYHSSLRASPNNEFTPQNSVTTRGNVDAVFASGVGKTLTARYDWPQHIHGMIGPSVAVASFNKNDGSLLIWGGSQNPVQTRADAAKMLNIPLDNVRVLHTEQASQFGRGGVDDAGSAAALLSYELGKPVRVQWMRGDEHAWGPQQPGKTHDIKATVEANGKIVAWQEESWGIRARWDQGWPLPWIMLGTKPVDAGGGGGGGIPSLLIPNVRTVAHTVDPLTRPMYLRTVDGTGTQFIQQSFVDELAAAAGVDSIEFWIRNMDPAGAATAPLTAMLRELQKRSGWQMRPSPAPGSSSGNIVRGRGVGVNGRVSNVAEVEVNRTTGVVRVTKLYAIADNGSTIVNPDGYRNQIDGGSIMGISRVLKEQSRMTRNSISSVDWVTYPILRFTEVPKIDITLMPTPVNIPSGGIGEPASGSVPVAVANAFFDATGVRMRSVPFTPARVRAALKAVGK
jgi:CO/xanthine dehydrogenase Mo-binding subunit